MAKILIGKPCADRIKADAAADIETLKRRGIRPALNLLRVGERPDDVHYEASIIRQAGRLGIQVNAMVLPDNAGPEAVRETLVDFSADDSVHGIMLFRPLHASYDEVSLLEAISPAKDVDGATRRSMGRIYAGQGGFAPCTPAAVVELLKFYDVTLEGAEVVVVGRSTLVGRPSAMMLLSENATITLTHSRTRDLAAVTRRADIVVAALGKAEFLNADYFSTGQTVIDVGFHEVGGVICGDVAFDQVEPLVSAISPASGGVGAITTAILLKQVVSAAKVLSQ